MKEITVKDNRSGRQILVNGYPDIDLMPSEIRSLFVLSLFEAVQKKDREKFTKKSKGKSKIKVQNKILFSLDKQNHLCYNHNRTLCSLKGEDDEKNKRASLESGIRLHQSIRARARKSPDTS